jgi:LacI family transcriptional regulator
MPKNVTIKDIAAEADVSIALVSFVMNNRIEADGKQKYRVNKVTREKILEVARKLNYQPNAAARTLRSGRSKVIGAILSDISNVFYGEIARKLVEIAFHHGYTVLFGSTDESPEKLDRIMRSFIDKGVDGFIIVPCEGSDKSIRFIQNLGIPFVIIDRKDMAVEAPKIVLDNKGAMKSAVDILIPKGFRKIEMLSYTMRVSSISDREDGFIEAMEGLGCSKDDINIHRLPFNDIDGATAKLMPGIIERGVEGLVFATNSLAIAAIKTLFSMGVKLQEDIYLVGFDNSDVYDLFDPPIPHVRQPISTICNEALEILFGLMDHGLKQTSSLIVLSGEVVNN